jgi:hypothetical protein
MLFNNDLLFIVGSVIVGGIFTYTFYNNIFTNYNSESLVNTLSNVSENTIPIPVPDPTPLPILGNNPNYVDVGVQTDVTSTWFPYWHWMIGHYCWI